MAGKEQESRASSLPQMERCGGQPACGSELARDSSGRQQVASRRVLMVAFHFPPQKGSSGLQRTLRFVQYLRGHGWAPAVLSAWPRAYAERSDDQLADIPADVPVLRAWGWDASRHFAIRGKYVGWMAAPDRWSSWVFPAFVAGLVAVRRWRPSVLFSTSPIPSAQVVGWSLQRVTGLPWVADLRDPLTGRASPVTRGFRHHLQQWVERLVARRAARIVFTSAAAKADFHQRYPQLPEGRLVVIENGYDEADFVAAAGLRATAVSGEQQGPSGDGKWLLHSGLISSTVRDPMPLFRALVRLLQDGRLSVNGENWCVAFRGAYSESIYRPITEAMGLGAVVRWLPALPYREALAEMLSADALLLLQGVDNDAQVPAKLYEYARAGRPIVALVGKSSQSATWLGDDGRSLVTPLEDEEAVVRLLPAFLARAAAGLVEKIPEHRVLSASREARTSQLAALLDDLLAVSPWHSALQGSP